jgi:hypothetical protein
MTTGEYGENQDLQARLKPMDFGLHFQRQLENFQGQNKL